MIDIQDEIIMEHVREGNLAEMSILFERYHLRMYNFFLKLTMDRDICQDLTQNLFYRMIKYKHTFKQGYSFRSWIYQMARNLHADLCRDEKKSNSLFINSEFLMNDVTDEGDGFGEEDYKRLDHALFSLNPEQREILVLSRYQGLKYEEISAITKLSVPAIKVAVHRAVKQLRVIYFKQI